MHKGATAALLCALCIFSSALGEGIYGQHYDTFLRYYGESLIFINENDDRHLLPLTISDHASDDGKTLHEINDKALTMSLVTDEYDEVVERCEITLTAPDNMEYGTAEYRDFAALGYHSYALLMAMDASAEASERYRLVTDVVSGMADDGAYSVQLGVYSLKCTREGSKATLLFEHTQTLKPAEQTGDEPTAEPAPEDVDEGAGLG